MKSYKWIWLCLLIALLALGARPSSQPVRRELTAQFHVCIDDFVRANKYKEGREMFYSAEWEGMKWCDEEFARLHLPTNK
jgi:hypothetical protein